MHEQHEHSEEAQDKQAEGGEPTSSVPSGEPTPSESTQEPKQESLMDKVRSLFRKK